MGAGASSIPDTVDKDTAKELAGDSWNESSEAQFDAAAAGGAVTKAQFEAAVAAASEAGGAAPAKTKRRYSLVGTEMEGESLADAATKRRDSVVAIETDDAVKTAPDEEKVGILLATMKTQWEKPVEETKDDDEFFSWALSCIAELSRGNEENRKKLLDGGAPALVLQFMDVTGRFGDDIFVQWQGAQAIGNLCCDEATANAFGEAGLEAVLYPMLNTDCSELSFTGMRALKQLITNSAANKALAMEREVGKALAQLTEDYPTYNQLKFMVSDVTAFLEAA